MSVPPCHFDAFLGIMVGDERGGTMPTGVLYCRFTSNLMLKKRFFEKEIFHSFIDNTSGRLLQASSKPDNLDGDLYERLQ
jgi:hypothetical protein